MKKYYYTIGEVCNLLEVKAHVLRYWEKEFSQLKPKKAKDRNRRYNPEDIELLKKIKFMLYTQKFTIDGARKKLKEQSIVRPQIELQFADEPMNDAKQKIKDQLLEIKKLLK